MNLEPDTPAPNPPAAALLATPPAGATWRMAAEMLDVLAEHLDEQPVGYNLTDLLTRSAEAAADAHGLPPNPWIRDGIETAALLGLAITALPLRVSQLQRVQLAARFAKLDADQQRTWVIKAADVLHRSNTTDSYGPPIGELLAREAAQAEGHSPAVGHVHEQGLHIQHLPACLAPADADRAAQPGLALPREGEAVVIANGQVMFLTAPDGTELVSPDATQLWAAPTIGEGCGTARWDPDRVALVDLAQASFPDPDAEVSETAWLLLIDHAGVHQAGGRSR